MRMNSVKTTCPYCGVGCGVIASVDEHGGVHIRGDPEHPANHGRLCSKGAALGETLDLDDRLLYPEVNGKRVDWDQALDTVAGRFREIAARHGPEAVAFYVSGQLLTEAYYVANKLMKGFIGSANIDTNSRLCMSSAVAAHRRAFGADLVPCSYEDLERAELIVLVGSNLAWCHPVLYQRLAQAKQRLPERRVVVIDPRKTASCEIADLHLALAPGSDSILFNGLLAYLADSGCADRRFLGEHTVGEDEALETARASAPDVATVARACGLSPEAVSTFYRWFAEHERTVTLFSQGINQSTSGTDKANGIINCHLYTGRIGRAGMGPFSITGQPNAMGGREVGALANELASHLKLDDASHRTTVREFWGAPSIAEQPGHKAADLFREVARGRVRALWIMGTNPVDSLPEADQVREALRACDLVVVSDCMRDTDTAALADVLLPALTWGERDGTVTNSERRISRQRPFLTPPGQARPDWWIICEVAKRMGHGAAFDYPGPHAIFDEHARLSTTAGQVFDIGGLAGMSEANYAGMKPVQWPVSDNGGTSTRLFGSRRFAFPDGRARLIAVTPRPPGAVVDAQFPLVLNTGRVRDHWHTMTRTAKAPRLADHTPEPYAEVHPDDARNAGVADGMIGEVVSRFGRVRVRVKVTEGQRRGSIFVPMHWNDVYSARARVGAVVNCFVDPVSGQPESKHTPVRLTPWKASWHGLIVSRRQLDTRCFDYWTRTRGCGLWVYYIAGEQAPADWRDTARSVLCRFDRDVNWVEYADTGAGRYRAARLTGERLESCIFIDPDYPVGGRRRVTALFERDRLSARDRAELLAASGSRGEACETVCACHGVEAQSIVDAVRSGRAGTVGELGDLLGAGTGCGSCKPELERLIATAVVRASA